MINAANAVEISKTHEALLLGRKLFLIITKPNSSYYQLPKTSGSNLMHSVLTAREVFV